jgi:hypothetical protein
MTPTISKELKKATETLQIKMLAMQEEEAKMLALKSSFVNSTDPIKKEKIKPALIAQAKKLKQAEFEADMADKMFHKILSNEPGDIYDLLDHKIQEHVVRMAVRKIVKESINLHENDEVSLTSEVEKFFKSNKKKLESLVDDNDWDEFYELGFEKFPDADQDDVAQAMNNAAIAAGWFENEIEDFRQSEKELKDMAFGSKAQQKGINMGDYSKKMKQPKASSSELYIESKKKDITPIIEAEYKGRKVKLNKPFYTPGGPRKRAVYVKNEKGNIVKVGFGDPNMRIKKSIPARRKSYRARHHCENPGPHWKANYWSCKAW